MLMTQKGNHPMVSVLTGLAAVEREEGPGAGFQGGGRALMGARPSGENSTPDSGQVALVHGPRGIGPPLHPLSGLPGGSGRGVRH